MSKSATLPPDPDHSPLMLRALAWLVIAGLLCVVGMVWHATGGGGSGT